MRYGVFALCIFILSGCISIPRSPTPRFYLLRSIEETAGRKVDIPAGTIIGFGPVRVPDYQNRAQIVVKDKNNKIKFAEFDRWGEPLDGALERVIGEDMAILLPNATIKTYPWNSSIPVKYRIIMDIVRLDSELDKDLVIAAEWSIIDAQNKKMLIMRKSRLRQAIDPHSYSGLAEALNTTCAVLAAEIAAALSSLSAQNEAMQDIPAPKT